MAAFIESLWNSVFTPGPTPPLLLATNATFGALQLLLFALLVATHSIHFLILSILSGALWWAINWFAGELMAAQAAEEEQRKRRGEAGARAGKESGDDTETEVEERGATRSGGKGGSTGQRVDTSESGHAARQSAGASSQLDLPTDEDALRKRRSLAESTGDLSTDSEWEKVDNDR